MKFCVGLEEYVNWKFWYDEFYLKYSYWEGDFRGSGFEWDILGKMLKGMGEGIEVFVKSCVGIWLYKMVMRVWINLVKCKRRKFKVKICFLLGILCLMFLLLV